MVPLTDAKGETLMDIRPHHPPADVPRPAALVVVCRSAEVLLGFDRWRKRWEIFGGRVESGESEMAAAARELAEEAGLPGVELAAAAVAEFRLIDPIRREEAAVFRAEPDSAALAAPGAMTPNSEIGAFHWWHPGAPPPEPASELDLAIVRWVLHQKATAAP